MIKKRSITLLLLLVLATGVSYAGDVATFLNLGFSEDSRVFMFGQYGVDAQSGKAYADLFTVDVPANRFVSGGVQRLRSDQPVEATQDGKGALFTLVRRHADLAAGHSIDHLATGRILYFALNEGEPKSQISFRDHQAGRSYRLRLHQSSRGRDETLRARFHIELETIDAEGRRREHTIGLPEFDRKGVKRYRIGQVYLSPDERSVVIVVEMEYPTATGKNVRYMVETARVH